MIEKLILNNDVCFFIEHWLSEEESYLFSGISAEHSILLEADFSCEERLTCNGVRGRPFGGRCWVVRNNLRVIDCLSKDLSRITVEHRNRSRLTIFFSHNLLLFLTFNAAFKSRICWFKCFI